MLNHNKKFNYIWCKSCAIGLAILIVGSFVASPAEAHCKGKHDPDANGGVCPPHDDGGVSGDLVTEGVVGHEFDALACENAANAEGDFYDVGTEDSCDILECTTGTNGQVVCGNQSHSTPVLNIQSFFENWSLGGRGDPNVCFDGGEISSVVHTTSSGGGTAIRVLMFIRGGQNDPALGCESSAVRYVGEVGDCAVEQGSYPPAAGPLDTVVLCDTNTPVEFKTEGGGKATKKCGCIFSGVLGSDTRLRFRVPDE